MKITCCIQRQNCEKELTTFSKINFVLEELGKLILLVITKKVNSVTSGFFALLLFIKFRGSRPRFLFSTQLGKHQNSAQALSALSLFSHFRNGL